MKNLLLSILAGALFALAACQTGGGPSSDGDQARPEVRYYMIADT